MPLIPLDDRAVQRFGAQIWLAINGDKFERYEKLRSQILQKHGAAALRAASNVRSPAVCWSWPGLSSLTKLFFPTPLPDWFGLSHQYQNGEVRVT